VYVLQGLDFTAAVGGSARRAKAQRGELRVSAAVAYLKTDVTHVEKDPDRRVQEAVALVFRKFVELGTVRQTLWWFLEHGVQLSVQTQRGETGWKRPSYAVLHHILATRCTAALRVWGRSNARPTMNTANHAPVVGANLESSGWRLIPNAHEGYVSWDEFERPSHV
jgi:Recombinase